MVWNGILFPTRRPGWLVAAALAAVLVAGVAGWALRTGETAPGIDRPAHTTDDGSGLVDGDGPVTVEIRFALGCAGCPDLAELARALDRPVAHGTVTRIYRPVVNDRKLVPAAATVGCAADQHTHPAYLAELLAEPAGQATRREPAPGAEAAPGAEPAPGADRLIYLAGAAGLIDPAFAGCVRAGQYRSWARGLTGSAGPPLVRVDRAVVEAQPDVVLSAVQAAAELRAR